MESAGLIGEYHELDRDRDRLQQRANAFWEKFMAHPESPKIEEWLRVYHESQDAVISVFSRQIDILAQLKQ